MTREEEKAERKRKRILRWEKLRWGRLRWGGKKKE